MRLDFARPIAKSLLNCHTQEPFLAAEVLELLRSLMLVRLSCADISLPSIDIVPTIPKVAINLFPLITGTYSRFVGER